MIVLLIRICLVNPNVIGSVVLCTTTAFTLKFGTSAATVLKKQKLVFLLKVTNKTVQRYKVILQGIQRIYF